MGDPLNLPKAERLVLWLLVLVGAGAIVGALLRAFGAPPWLIFVTAFVVGVLLHEWVRKLWR